MALYSDRINNHPIQQSLEEYSEILSMAEPLVRDMDEDAIEAFHRLHQVNKIVVSILTQSDPLLIPHSILDNLQAAIAQQKTNLTSFYKSKGKAQLIAANDYLEQVLNLLSRIPAFFLPENIEAIKTGIASYRKSIGQYFRHIQDEHTALLARFNELETRMETTGNEITSQKSRLDTAITEFQQQFSKAEETRREQSSQQEHNRTEEFLRLIANQRESLQSILTDHRDQWNAFMASRDKESDVIINQLSDYKHQAESLVNIIANSGMSSGYQKVANSERTVAWLWQILTLISMLGLIGFSIYAFVHTINGNFSWGVFAGRAFVAAAFGIVSAYAARQADKHQENERRNRRLELEIASINPFLSGFPDELQYEIKREVALRIFGQLETSSTSSSPSTTGTPVDVLKVALETTKTAIDAFLKK